MAGELSREELRRLARLGAMRRLEELRREEHRIRAMFPELFGGKNQAGRDEQESAPKGRRRRMSAAARRAVSLRMKRYWAERRKAAKAAAKAKG